jgi:cell division protein FtsZ
MFELEEQVPGFELSEASAPGAVIKVVGVGGAGGNAVQRMIEAGVRGVQFIAMNTDAQALNRNAAPTRLQLGMKVTGGMGSGANPEVARQAALESEAEITETLRGADMVFIAAGMGKGTGTGAAPVVADIARRLGILTVPVVTRPFSLEGEICCKRADAGLAALRGACDSVLVIPNDRIMTVSPRLALKNSFKEVDDTLRFSIQAISDVVTLEGMLNTDFNDVRTVMNGQKGIYLGCGAADGDDAAPRAALQALKNPYLENAFHGGAKGMLVAISVKDDSRFSATDLNAILSEVRGLGCKDVNLIHGIAWRPEQLEDVRVTVIATGYEGQPAGSKGAPNPDDLPILDVLNGSNGQPSRKVRVEPFPLGGSEDLDIPAFMRRHRLASLEAGANAG